VIVRTGWHAIKYTHDSEAAYAEMRFYRELAYMRDVELMAWIKSMECYAPDYWYFEEDDEFLEVKRGWCGDFSRVRRVKLHNFDTLTRRCVRENGFSCTVCGCFSIDMPTAQQRWLFLAGEIAEVVRKRQSTDCPPLVCRECLWFLNCFDLYGTEKVFTRKVDAVIDRVLETRRKELVCS
jgi:hypothetical protein